MSDPIWARPFPGGVVDTSGRYALLRDAAGRCVALRLTDGRLLWRSTESLRPLLVDDHIAVGLAMTPPRVVALSLQGGERWRSVVLPWPEWALQEPELNSASDLNAAWIDGDVLLRWQLRAQRGGGAGRGPTHQPPPVCDSAARLGRNSGVLQVPYTSPLPSFDEAAGTTSDDTHVLAQTVLAGVRYALVQHDDGALLRTALVAQDKNGAGGTRWSCMLDEVERQRPPPHRP
jgi:hypothetical protein